MGASASKYAAIALASVFVKLARALIWFMIGFHSEAVLSMGLRALWQRVQVDAQSLAPFAISLEFCACMLPEVNNNTAAMIYVYFM